MRKLFFPLLAATALEAQAGSDHCDTFDPKVQFEIQAPVEQGGFMVSRVIPKINGDIQAALGDIDPNNLLLVHNAQGGDSEELLVAQVNHGGDSHIGVGTFELNFEGTKAGNGWIVSGNSVVICRSNIDDPLITAALKLSSKNE